MEKSFLKKCFLAIIAVIVLLSIFYFVWLRPRYVVPILFYHRFGYEKRDRLFVTPENFARQMKYIKDKRYNVLSLDELVSGIEAGKKFAHNSVVITIDDGYEDCYSKALAVLKDCGFTATIFIIADHIDGEGYLSWEQVRTMRDAGIDFGAHTKSDIYMPSVTDRDTLWEQTAGAKGLIEQELDKVVYYFAYPIGGFTQEIKDILKKSGYKGACTSNRGKDRFNKDVFELKRIKITNSDMNKPFSFRAKLSGSYNLFRRTRPGD